MAIAAVLTMTFTQARATQLETLVMPGKLTQAHANIEPECKKCHARFDRSRQSALCLDCHEQIAADIEQSSGFHGRESRVAGAECVECHTEHVGRGADIVGLDERTFDHALTDFLLDGAHTQAACRDCHAAGATFHAATPVCGACHEDDDVHHGGLGEQCADCHDTGEWKDAHFDHDTTAFRLLGRHREAACLDCHADQTFTGASGECVACHRDDDVHGGSLGVRCQDCHAAAGWEDVSGFDHRRDTGFALAGGHAGLDCNACHSAEPARDALQTDCYACHLKDDEHEGHNGRECERCHVDTAWDRIAFDHGRDTDFPLNGAHAGVECATCHVQPVYTESLRTGCVDCHADDDVHDGEQGTACARCHSETSWKQQVVFDHGLTLFPLLGAHADVACESCHETQRFREAPTACLECHRDDDPHGDHFGSDCETCHNAVGWEWWAFDHDAQTRYPLEGAHRDVACASCHDVSLASLTGAGGECARCHRKHDVHHGEFGRDCARCHTTRSFDEPVRLR